MSRVEGVTAANATGFLVQPLFGAPAMVGISTTVSDTPNIANTNPPYGQPMYERSDGSLGLRSVKQLDSSANVEKIMTYITVTFHTYIRQTISPLSEHWHRVAEEYGSVYPELQTITKVLHETRSEILSYLYFKERVLYPFIKEVFDREGIRHTSSKDLHWRVCRALSHGETMDLSICTDLQTIESLSDNFSAPPETARYCELAHEELRIFVEQWRRHSYSEIHVLHPKVRLLTQHEQAHR